MTNLLVERGCFRSVLPLAVSLTIVATSAIGCKSSGTSGGGSSFSFPWKKHPNVPAAPPSSDAPSSAPDPFLPPVRSKDKDRTPGPGASLGQPSHEVARQTDFGDPIALVTARETVVETGLNRFTSNLNAILKPGSTRRDFRYIVLHQSRSDSGNLSELDRRHRKTIGWEGCGYHFVIGNGAGSGNGEIEVSDRWVLQKPGMHVDAKAPREFNDDGIGICLIGDFSSKSPTPKQITASRALIAYLATAYSIPPYRILSNGEVTGESEEGPDGYLRIDELLLSPR